MNQPGGILSIALTVLALGMCLATPGCFRGEPATNRVNPTANSGNTGNVKPPLNEPEGNVPEGQRTWTVSEDTAGRFSVTFPGKPELTEPPVSILGGRVRQHRCAVKEFNAVWEVRYYDIPQSAPKDPAGVFSEWILDMYRTASSIIDADDRVEISLGGKKFEGRRLVFEGSPASADIVRTYLVKNRVFTVRATTSTTERYEEIAPFFKSFSLVGELPESGWPAKYMEFGDVPKDPK